MNPQDRILVEAPPAACPDRLTVMAIAIVAYLLANVLHEGLGHAGACVSSAARRVPSRRLILMGTRRASTVSAFGFLLLAGRSSMLPPVCIFLWLGRCATRARGSTRYFVWLSMTVNLLVAAGYPLFSGALGIGDWVQVVEGWEPAVVWRLVLTFAGVALYGTVVWISLRELGPMLGSERPASKRRGVCLTVIAYLTGSLASTLGAFLNPMGAAFVLTSAAAHFGGTSALAWMAQMLDTRWLPPVDGEPMRIQTSWPWRAVAIFTLAGHIAVLGPGFRF